MWFIYKGSTNLSHEHNVQAFSTGGNTMAMFQLLYICDSGAQDYVYVK